MRPAAGAPLLVVLTGPTGTGKSALALELAGSLAATLPMEIVSVDSAQVYRGMDIGTAKPDRAARAHIAHHLIDIRDPSESYSAGEFVREARACIAAIHARGHVPLLVGGTLLYLRALHEGLAAMPPASEPVRAQLDALAAERGWPALHAELMQVDPWVAARIAPQDAQRIQRALEVYRLTGTPISQWQRRTRGAAGEYHWLRYALWPESRARQRSALADRFAAMMRAGLLEEVRALHARGDLNERHSAVRAVGYRQLWKFCDGGCSLDEAVTAAVIATAQLAKRQLTWLRRDTALKPLQAGQGGLTQQLERAIRVAAGA